MTTVVNYCVISYANKFIFIYNSIVDNHDGKRFFSALLTE